MIESHQSPSDDLEDQNINHLFESLVLPDSLKKVVTLEHLAQRLYEDYGIILDKSKIEKLQQSQEFTLD